MNCNCSECAIFIARFEGIATIGQLCHSYTLSFHCKFLNPAHGQNGRISPMLYPGKESPIDPVKLIINLTIWTDQMKEFDQTNVTRTLGTFAKLIMGRICGN